MYEWHGWATFESTPAVVDFGDPGEADALRAVHRLVEDAQGIDNETVDIRYANGMLHLWLAGSHNHYAPRPHSLYRAFAEAAPGSYGVLYAMDHDAGEQWVRYVMRRGHVYEETDTSLSPHVPLAEDEST